MTRTGPVAKGSTLQKNWYAGVELCTGLLLCSLADHGQRFQEKASRMKGLLGVASEKTLTLKCFHLTSTHTFLITKADMIFDKTKSFLKILAIYQCLCTPRCRFVVTDNHQRTSYYTG